MIKKIGVLGLGRMGGTAARLLLADGHEVFAVDRPSTRWLLDAGGNLVGNPRTLGEVADLIILLLAREEDVETAIFGADGLAEGGQKGMIVADMGTFGVAFKERIYEALTLLAPKCNYVGPFGHGIKLKFVLNAMVTNHVLVTAEALNIGIASGLEPQQIIDAVTSSVATSTQFELRAPVMAARKWQPAPAPASLVEKDTRYIVEHAEALGVAAPVAVLTRDYYAKVAEMGLLEGELSIIYEALQTDNRRVD